MNPGAWVHRKPRMNPACATGFATGFAMNPAHVIGLAMNPARAWVHDIPDASWVLNLCQVANPGASWVLNPCQKKESMFFSNKQF
ncbi:hypothetical protein SLEP1_g1358 [Rubroshorea leprosula]|uniref:Uncharacterized protein n=1 Tax=Rubroshorea leprosula TaxID=152421 RepID=A0AAV5HN44_9ROSI|nr:hypothetical protein SLEP1_g1358 [Rubroshorea leprosula]